MIVVTPDIERTLTTTCTGTVFTNGTMGINAIIPSIAIIAAGKGTIITINSIATDLRCRDALADVVKREPELLGSGSALFSRRGAF
ncbi:hypothetical protein [Marinobacterium arenosum]|uniref:hypothetical protein n=1 Tax=Marinobacterium arenosum TaxID=2862496 RepID=UPI001C95BC25|nr:hypothetical protein [Marinobacterium arenosum]MBY4678389.1 hypothetical protein [Marinobacterium arenosum]